MAFECGDDAEVGPSRVYKGGTLTTSSALETLHPNEHNLSREFEVTAIEHGTLFGVLVLY